MFHGMIEGRNPSDPSVTIETDFVRCCPSQLRRAKRSKGSRKGTAFALNLNADGFLTRNVSLGPLLQLAFTGDMTQVGFSGQAKYWIAIPDTGNWAKLVLQAGPGFVHADFLRSDTSWLIPLGVGLDYAVHRSLSLTTTFLLNFTDLDTEPGTHTNVMPGLTFGVRF